MLPIAVYTPKDRIANSKDKAKAHLGRRGLSGRDFLRQELVKMGLLDMLKNLDVLPRETKNPVLAIVNKGRWIANCECGGAEVVDDADPVFFCLSCLNQNDKYQMRRVVFPPDAAQIERILLNRANPIHRNWNPHESLGDLKYQNREHKEREE